MLDQLIAVMRSHSIAVVEMQETKWTNSTKVPSCADYTIGCRDRGLAFLVDKSIAHHQLTLVGAGSIGNFLQHWPGAAYRRECLHPSNIQLSSRLHCLHRSLLTFLRQFDARRLQRPPRPVVL
ncbi:unnamed protein product [Dibothriocephalus latus]|uniref:Uncharacterized protein n=1 Tax=Dibothriocephalus latus TaxID=60516 RepID=A0A3P7NTH4_DIBLA|nr:unnamed protein product [Dibothriocephalus latus]